MTEEVTVVVIADDENEKKEGEEEEEEEEEEEYEVERIIKSKKTKGTKYYLVRWKNYGSDDDTWEPEENLVDCADAFQDFQNREKERMKKEEEKRKDEEKRWEERKKKEEGKRKDDDKKNALLGQKRRRINEHKSKKFISSDEEDDNNISKSPPLKKPTEKKEPKRTYKFMSDDDDKLGMNTTPKIEKKKLSKVLKTPKSEAIRKVVDDPDKYFASGNDDYMSTNHDIIRAKREKKRKKKDRPAAHESQNHVVQTPLPKAPEPPPADVPLTLSHLDDLILPFGIDIRVPHPDGIYRVTLPIPLEYEDPSGKMSGLENINWSLAVYYDALDLLIRSNCIQDVQTLLTKQKLNVNQLYGDHTLVSLSSYHGKRRMTDMLLRYNPDVNQPLDKGRIALHLAAQQGYSEICVSLIEAGSNVNARDAILETALMKAAENGHRQTVEMLLDYGSNFSLVNCSFKTAEDLAREKQHEFIAQKIHYRGEQIADAFINVHKAGCTLKEQLLPVHTIFPEFNSTLTLCFSTDHAITSKLIVSRLIIRKGDIGKLLDYSLIKCQWMNQILSLEYPGSVIFKPRIGLNTLVLNFKEHIKKYGIEPLLVSAFSVLVTLKRPEHNAKTS